MSTQTTQKKYEKNLSLSIEIEKKNIFLKEFQFQIKMKTCYR